MENTQRAVLPKQPIRTAFAILFGIITIAIGAINLFWGNDPGYGAFIIVLSTIFFPPTSHYFTARTGLPIPSFLKVVVALFIIWTALGVGELLLKIDMMLKDIQS